MKTKDELIEWLINDDIANVATGDCNAWLDTILREGFVGYRNQSLEDLTQEYNERKE